MARVIVVASACLYSEAISLGLASRDGCEIVARAHDADSGLGLVRDARPEVVFVDSSLPDGVSFVRELCAIQPVSPAVIVLVVAAQMHEVVEWISAGASGILTREASLDDLARAVADTARGTFACSTSVLPLMAKALRELRRSIPDPARFTVPVESSANRLTRRETEIFSLLQEGLSNKEIAKRLFIDISTVKNHVHNILQKTRLKGRELALRSSSA